MRFISLLKSFDVCLGEMLAREDELFMGCHKMFSKCSLERSTFYFISLFLERERHVITFFEAIFIPTKIYIYEGIILLIIYIYIYMLYN